LPPSRRSAEAGGLAAAWRRRGPAACLLFPFSLIFKALVAVRRVCYRIGMLHREHLPVPVVVVGNITVGGTGKTPLVIHLALALRASGRHPGIVSRGYGGHSRHVREVTGDSDPKAVGDEPLLLARRASCPVFVGRDRVAAARSLLASHPECDLIIADDGLQHYRLARDVELALIDARGVDERLGLAGRPLARAGLATGAGRCAGSQWNRRVAGADFLRGDIFDALAGEPLPPPRPAHDKLQRR
jgi:tetraacyldisaccharide 4'-kinase